MAAPARLPRKSPRPVQRSCDRSGLFVSRNLGPAWQVLEPPNLSPHDALPTFCCDCPVDFGHELITAVHTPIVWSDRRPTDKEFRDSFSATKLSAQKILDFMHQRQSVIQKVVLTNSEGYWSGEFSITPDSIPSTICATPTELLLPCGFCSRVWCKRLPQAQPEDPSHCLQGPLPSQCCWLQRLAHQTSLKHMLRRVWQLHMHTL